MERAWPFAIDAVPLQFGSAAITKVTAQFYYTKHYLIENKIPYNPNNDNEQGQLEWGPEGQPSATEQLKKAGLLPEEEN